MIELSLEEIQTMDDANEGICVSCGEIKDCCEPDAHEYTCDYCGLAKVYGAMEAMIQGLITVT